MIQGKKPKIISQQQFVLNQKTIALINWLIEFDQESLKKLLAKACQNGALLTKNEEDINEETVHNSFFRLVSLIEILSEEVIEEQDVSHVFHQSLIPAIKNLDSTEFEQSTIQHSAAKALYNAKNKKAQPSALLFEELLKKWKPKKKLLQ